MPDDSLLRMLIEKAGPWLLGSAILWKPAEWFFEALFKSSIQGAGTAARTAFQRRKARIWLAAKLVAFLVSGQAFAWALAYSGVLLLYHYHETSHRPDHLALGVAIIASALYNHGTIMDGAKERIRRYRVERGALVRAEALRQPEVAPTLN